VKAGKADKGRILDQVVGVMGWFRDNVRRRLVAAARLCPGGGRAVAQVPCKAQASKFSFDTVKVLQRVWAASGGQCGKYLAASMHLQLDGLERHGELVFGENRYSRAVREELLVISGASIDRYLAPAKARDAIRGKTTTKPSPLLRSAITTGKAGGGQVVKAEPGFFEGDTVAHCGPTLKGEFARTPNLTDVHTGPGRDGCGAMFAAGAFILIPQSIAVAIGLTATNDNLSVAAVAGAVVGIIAAYAMRWFLISA
jgi:hypothetical protein